MGFLCVVLPALSPFVGMWSGCCRDLAFDANTVLKHPASSHASVAPGVALQTGTTWYSCLFPLFSAIPFDWPWKKAFFWSNSTVKATVDASEWCNEKGFPLPQAGAKGNNLSALVCLEKQRLWRYFFHITGKPVHMCRIFCTLCTEAGLYG